MNALFHLAADAKAGASPVDLLVALFLLGLVPLLAVSCTSFTRVIIVLGLLRSSIGSPSLPPNVVLAGMALMLTGVIMAPTFAHIQSDIMTPYDARRLSAAQAVERGARDLQAFMVKQTRQSDVDAFARMSGAPHVDAKDAPFGVVAPAFLIGELRAAFAMGFTLALPFAVIDIVVAAVLMSLGMYMVSPAALSLPIKLLVFVLADGWALVASALVASYR